MARVLVLFIGLGVAPAALLQDPGKTPTVAPQASPQIKLDDLAVDKLIEQLNSRSFADREKAHEMLLRAGAIVLPRLRRAMVKGDLEFRRRVDMILDRIEESNLREIAARPRRVQLKFEQTSMRTAIAEVERKLGFNLLVGANSDDLAERRITLNTGEVNLWRAFEEFCEKADLVPGSVLLGSDIESLPPVHGRMFVAAAACSPKWAPKSAAQNRNRLVQTDLDGRLRVHGALARYHGSESIGGFNIEVWADPTMRVLDFPAIIVDKILDKDGKNLLPLASSLRATDPRDRKADDEKGQFVNGPAARPDLGVLAFIPCEKQGFEVAAWREIRGVVFVDSVVDYPLLRVDSLADVVGKTVSGRRNLQLSLLEMKFNEQGDLQLELLIPNRDRLFEMGMTSKFDRTRSGTVIRRDPVSLLLSQLDVRDAEGVSWIRDDVEIVEANPGTPGMSRTKVVFRGRATAGGRPRLSLDLKGTRVIRSEFPFSLKRAEPMKR